MAIKPQDCADHIIEAHISFVEGLEEFKVETTLADALLDYLENGKISSDIEYLFEQKENTEEKPTRGRRGRPNKQTLKEITENAIQIKTEKISEVYTENTTTIVSVTENVVVKTEKEDMPAPTALPPWKKKIKTEPEEVKRSTRTRGKKKIEEAQKEKEDSDVEIQNAVVTTIELLDESTVQDTNSEVPSDTDSEKSTRSTRTKTKKKVEEKSETDSTASSTRSTRTKTLKNKNTESDATGDNSAKSEELPQRSTRTKTRAKLATQTEVESEVEPQEETRSTRTKTRANKAKRVRDESTDTETQQTEKKRSRSDSDQSEAQPDQNTTTKTVFEDARTSLDEKTTQNDPVNATFVKTPPRLPPVAPDATVIVTKPKFVNHDNGVAAETTNDVKTDDPLLTDDESEVEEEAKKTTGAMKKKGTVTQVFSPYDKTPVKNKVKAFEILAKNGSSSSNIPRSMQTLKAGTPNQTNFLPKVCSTSKVPRVLGAQKMSTDTSFASQRSYSALKANQAEYRERERLRLEKEREAQKKKDAMLASIVEEKRKRREEKQQKAQQQREAKEREKQRILEEQEREKAEKHRQAVKEKEEKAAKQREDLERKRLLAKQKAAKERELQATQEADRERQKLADQQREEKIKLLQQQQQRQLPAYLTSRPPLLPTYDCYDSDDPEYGTKYPPSGAWDRDPSKLKEMQYIMMAAGDRIKNTLFCVHSQSVNLADIFENIDPRKLKRTSSACWRRPPRFTMMPNLEETRFSEDDEDNEDED